MFAAGLVIVSVRVEVPPTAMVEGENDLAISAGISTARLALAVPPRPLVIEFTAPVVFVATPDCESVTFTDKVQLLVGGTVPPLKLTELPPAIGANVGEPQLVLVVAFGIEATVMPSGKVSLTATPV